MRRIGAVLGGLALVGVMVFSADTVVDQGKPGVQGAWPVSVSGGWSPDGGTFGALTGIQGMGADAGVAWDFTSTTIQGSARWRLQQEFDLRQFFRDDGGTNATTRIVIGFLDGGWGAERIPLAGPNYRGITPSDYAVPIMITSTYYNATSPTVYVRSYSDATLAQIEATAGQLANSSVSVAGTGTGSGLYVEGPYASPGAQPFKLLSTIYGSSSCNVQPLRSSFLTIEVTGNWTSISQHALQVYTYE